MQLQTNTIFLVLPAPKQMASFARVC